VQLAIEMAAREMAARQPGVPPARQAGAPSAPRAGA
jgi:hypothetical protein